MSISPAAASAIASVGTVPVASAADALDFSDAATTALTDQIRSALGSRVAIGSALVDQVLKMSLLLARVQTYGKGPFSPVSVASLESTPKTSDALDSLFLKDGPALGSSVADAQETLDQLSEFGISIEATPKTPVLIQAVDKNGNLISKSVTWMTDAEVAVLKKGTSPKQLPPEQNYPGAETSELKIVGFGGGAITATFWFFSDNRKLVPNSPDSINTAMSRLAGIAEDLNSQFEQTLQESKEKADALQEQVDNNLEQSKDTAAKINALFSEQQEQLNQLLAKIRTLKVERDLNPDTRKQGIGDAVSAIVRNGSRRIEAQGNVAEDMADRQSAQQILDALIGEIIANNRDVSSGISGTSKSGSNEGVINGLVAGHNVNKPENRVQV